MRSNEKLQTEFDKAAIALAKRASGDSHLRRNRAFLNKYLPAQCQNALEIGCGLGDFSRYLAGRSEHVLALDLSPEMIRIARERSTDFPQIEFLVADAMEYAFPTERFDFVVSFMTLHHMRLDEILEKLKVTLKPGGVLVVLDICEQDGVTNKLYSLFSRGKKLTKRLLRRIAGKQARHSSEESVWHHDRREVFPEFKEVSRICENLLPSALVQKYHRGDRYSIVWKKP